MPAAVVAQLDALEGVELHHQVAVEVLEAVDPHHPPSGCRYHTRCPIGPLVLPDREVCREAEPTDVHLHRAACHFAPPIVTPPEERSTP